MSEFVIRLDDPAAVSPEKVGGKAANLARFGAPDCRRRAASFSRRRPTIISCAISGSMMRDAPTTTTISQPK